MTKKFINLKQKILKLYPIHCGGLSKDFEVGHMRASGLIGYFYDFSVDYGAIAVDDILDIHKYLMKRNGIV